MGLWPQGVAIRVLGHVSQEAHQGAPDGLDTPPHFELPNSSTSVGSLCVCIYGVWASLTCFDHFGWFDCTTDVY